MKPVILLALLAMSACSTGDPYEDARISSALMAFGVGASGYGATLAAYQPIPRQAFCYPVGRGWSCN